MHGTTVGEKKTFPFH